MDIFMHRLMRSGLWLGVVAVMAVGVVGCNSTTTQTEAVTVAEDASSSDQATTGEVTAAPSPAEESAPQACGAGDPPASRANPFSEDSVEALEAMLRPLEAIPVETQATVSKDG